MAKQLAATIFPLKLDPKTSMNMLCRLAKKSGNLEKWKPGLLIKLW